MSHLDLEHLTPSRVLDLVLRSFLACKRISEGVKDKIVVESKSKVEVKGK